VLGLPYRLLIGAVFAVAAAGYATAALRGPYVKIQPGRLELLTGKWFSPHWRIEKSMPLDDARVTADLKKGWLEINRGEDRIVINLWLVERPVQLVKYACVGAVTKEVALAGH
jgi:hypothetical protein